jgi:hypothetical protein
MGVHYTQSEVTVTLGAVTQNQNRLVVKTVVYARLVTDQADPDENGHFITTEGYYPYTVTVAANGTVYKIVSVSLDTLDENPWFINPQTLAPSVDFTAESKAAPSPMQVAYTYNRINAANYAYRYWSSPNSAYCDFSSGGGDCTNFVSQCLSAGGWNGNTRWYWNGYCNYLNGVGYSLSWSVANSFYNFVLSSSRIYPACYSPNSLSVGDILQQRFSGSSTVGHTMIVTKKVNGVSYVTYRSAGSNSARKDVIGTTISGTLYGWRVNNTGS